MSSLHDYIQHNPLAVEGIYFSDNKSSKQFLEGFGNSTAWITEKTKSFMPKDISGNFAFAVKHKSKNFEDVFSDSLPPSISPIILALDHIVDPRNLGAIVRSCAFFGVSHVIVPQHRQVHLTSSAVATAMGGFASVQLTVATSLRRALEFLADKYGFQIVGTAMDGVQPDMIFKKSSRVALVLGSEEKGISEGVREICHELISIKHRYPPKVQSLNVSVCSGILLDTFFRTKNSDF